MARLHNLSALFYRGSSWYTVAIVVLVYGLFLMFVMAPQGELMRTLASDWGAPDGHFFYTPDELYAQLALWSEAGRQQYIRFRLGLDPLWAVTYASFLITISSLCLNYALPANDRRRLWNLLPLLPAAADIVENFLGVVLVSQFPERLDWLAWITACVTAFKWTSLGFAHVLMVWAIGMAFWRRTQQK